MVDDQYGNPTLADDLARGIYELVRWGKRGVYHVAGADFMSRYEFARKLAEVFGYHDSLITPIKTADLNQLATRPLQSGLITLKAQAELSLNFLTVEESLKIFKHQFWKVRRSNAKTHSSSSGTPEAFQRSRRTSRLFS